MTSLRMSRRKAFALGGGAMAGAALAACGGGGGQTETERFGHGDIGVVNYVLMLERVNLALYAEIAEGGLARGAAGPLVASLRAQEEEHVKRLTEVIKRVGGRPIPTKRYSFKVDRANALSTAAEVEELVAAAYLGQLPHVEDAGVVSQLLGIHSVEGGHSAAIDIHLGRPFTPSGGFAKPKPVSSVLQALASFEAS